jgi:hypothetical protein
MRSCIWPLDRSQHTDALTTLLPPGTQVTDAALLSHMSTLTPSSSLHPLMAAAGMKAEAHLGTVIFR